MFKTFNTVLPCAGHEADVTQRLGRRIPAACATVEAVEGGVRVVSPAGGTVHGLQNLGEQLSLARAEYAPHERWEVLVTYRGKDDLNPFDLVLHAGPGRVDVYEVGEEPR